LWTVVTATALGKFLDEQEKSLSATPKKRVAPVIKRLTAWREANGLSQSQAVEVLQAAGLPAKLKTLQAWEGRTEFASGDHGRHSGKVS
jgi:hypothetical protein